MSSDPRHCQSDLFKRCQLERQWCEPTGAPGKLLLLLNSVTLLAFDFRVMASALGPMIGPRGACGRRTARSDGVGPIYRCHPHHGFGGGSLLDSMMNAPGAMLLGDVPGTAAAWAAAYGGVTNGGLRGVWLPFLEIGRNRPFSPFFCLFRRA